MTCTRIPNGFLCSHDTIDVFVCFEHTTYRMEFSEQFGPFWYRVPEEEQIIPDPEGHLSILWDIFDQWYTTFRRI